MYIFGHKDYLEVKVLEKQQMQKQTFHICLKTVNTNVSLYKKGGTDALLIKKQPGVPKKLTAEQEKTLYDIIATKTPEEAGVGIFVNWTAPLACSLVKVIPL